MQGSGNAAKAAAAAPLQIPEREVRIGRWAHAGGNVSQTRSHLEAGATFQKAQANHSSDFEADKIVSPPRRTKSRYHSQFGTPFDSAS